MPVYFQDKKSDISDEERKKRKEIGLAKVILFLQFPILIVILSSDHWLSGRCDRLRCQEREADRQTEIQLSLTQKFNVARRLALYS